MNTMIYLKRNPKALLCMLLITTFGFFSHNNLNAQQHLPVTANVNIAPPYTTYLTDYISPGSNKLIVNLVFNDFNEPSWDVYLRLKVESNNIRITSKPDFKPTKPITLTPGVPLQISGNELYQYFDFNNIEVVGMSKADLISSGKLIEGTYKFCFEVCDYNKRVPISLESCAFANIVLNDPPRLVLPVDKTVIDLTTQSINFQWQLTGGNPNNTKYELSIYELENFNTNASVAIKENRALKIFESTQLDNPLFVYDITAPLLKRGKKYAWQVRAITVNNREEYKNQGLSQISCFYYGYPEGGSIKLYGPEDGHSFSLRDSKTFRWFMPDNLTQNQPFYYNHIIVKVDDGQTTAEAIEKNTPIFTKKSQILNPRNNNYEVTVSPSNIFQSNKKYAWKVTAHTNDQTIASSAVYSCYGPPLIEAFYAGNHVVYVTKTNSSNINDLTGEGEVSVSYDDKKKQKVYFEHIKVERIGALLIMTEGIVKAKYTCDIITLKAKYEPNGNATFNPDSIIIDKDYMRLKGVVKWNFPHPTVRPRIAVVESVPTWLIFEQYKLIGDAHLKDSLSYDLADPYGFNISLDTSSYFNVLDNNNFKLNFSGKIKLPNNVKNTAGTEVTLPFIDTERLDFIEQKLEPSSSSIELIKGSGINLMASSYIIDFCESISPAKKSTQTDWKGVYFLRSKIEFPVSPDKTNQLFLKHSFSYALRDTINTADTCWVTTAGLQFKVNKGAEKPDSLWFNTFPGTISNYQINITNSTLTSGLFKGSIEIPFLSEKKSFPFTVPLTVKGFATGYLDESLDGLTVTFNPDGGEQKIDLTINRAVFADNQRLDINADIKWPFLNIEMKSTEGFRIWGNGNIGFLTPNGALPLTNQLQTRINGFEINLDYIGCGRQENLYSIGISSTIAMAEDISGPDGAPVANIYSIAKNSLLKGNASYSNLPDAYQNIIIKNNNDRASYPDNNIGLNPNDQFKADSLNAAIYGNKFNQEVDSILSKSSIDSLQSLIAKRSIDSLQNLLTKTQKAELSPAYAADDKITVEKVIELIDLVSVFLNEKQRAKADEFKEKITEFDSNELVVLYRELQNLDQYVKKMAKDALKGVVYKINQPIINEAGKIKGRVIGFIDGKKDTLLASFDRELFKLVDTLARRATSSLSPAQRSGKESIIAEIIRTTSEATKLGISNEINRSVSLSIKTNITDKIVGIIDTAVVLKITSFVDSALLTTGNAIIEKGSKANIQFDKIGNDAKNLLPSIGEDLAKRVTAINFENTIVQTITDSYKNIRWDSIGNYIAKQVLIQLVEKKLMAAVTNTVVDATTGVLGENAGNIAGAVLGNVKFDFNNIGEKLKKGQFDKIVKFDPSHIRAKTTVAEFEGWLRFTNDDPVWGDSWQAILNAKIKTGFNISVSAKYINGTTDSTINGKGFKYWFLEVGADSLNIPLGTLPIAINGIKGKVFHHMKNTGNGIYLPVDTVKFGAGLQLFFFDTSSEGKIIAFDIGAEVTVLDAGFIFEIAGNAFIANVTLEKGGKKILSRTLVLANGYMCYNSIDEHFVGLFNAHTNTSPLLCAEGEFSVDIGYGKWSMNIGTREKPLFIDVLCTRKPIFKGWFAINNNGLDLGVITSLKLNLSSPWIGFTGFKVKPWAKFNLDFGTTAIVYWNPDFAIQEAHVWIDIYAGVGIKYEFLVTSGNLTIAAVNLGGEVLFTTIPKPYIEGKMYGKVTVFDVSVGFDMDVKHEF